VQAWAEKVSNITDYTLGRAPNTPNAPRTRGGQAMMLQQSNIAFGLLVAIHAQSFLEVFRRVHSYHKKYSRPGEVYRVMNKQTGMMQQKSVRAGMFDIDCDFQFVLNPNRQVEQQTKQVLFQITMQAMMQAMQAPPLAPSIRTALGDLYLSHGMKNFDQIWPEQMLQMQMQPPQGPPGMPPGPQGAPGQELQALEQAQGAGEPIEEKYGYESAPETSMEEEKVGIS